MGQGMTLEELRAMMEAELENMRNWKQRDYATERAIVEVLENPTDAAAIMRAQDMLSAALKEDLRKAEPEGNA
jgi:hypothetical protein